MLYLLFPIVSSNTYLTKIEPKPLWKTAEEFLKFTKYDQSYEGCFNSSKIEPVCSLLPSDMVACEPTSFCEKNEWKEQRDNATLPQTCLGRFGNTF